MKNTNKQQLITEIVLMIKNEVSIKELLIEYDIEDVSTAYWIIENEQIIEIEEDFEIKKNNYGKNNIKSS